MSAETKNPPPSWAGGLDEKKSYSVGLSRFQSDRVKTFEGRKGGADRAICGEVDFGVLEFVGKGVSSVDGKDSIKRSTEPKTLRLV